MRIVLLSIVCAGLGGRAIRAQALPTAAGLGSYVEIGGGITAFQADYGQRVLGGGVVYADINPTWRYGFEVEARYLRVHSAEEVTETNYLAGVKISPRPSKVNVYGKFLAGAGHINLPFGYAQGTFLSLAPGAGVDYKVGDRWRVKLIDFEYQRWIDFPYGELHPYGVTFGVAYRINGLEQFPKNGRRSRH